MHGKEPVARIVPVGFTNISGEVVTAILLTACLKPIAKAQHNAHTILDLRYLTQTLSMRPENWIEMKVEGFNNQRVSCSAQVCSFRSFEQELVVNTLG